MDRAALIELSRAQSWKRAMTRGEIRELLALLDAKDARIRELEGQVSRSVDHVPELVADVRRVAGVLQDSLEVLSEHLERRMS